MRGLVVDYRWMMHVNYTFDSAVWCPKQGCMGLLSQGFIRSEVVPVCMLFSCMPVRGRRRHVAGSGFTLKVKHFRIQADYLSISRIVCRSAHACRLLSAVDAVQALSH